MNQDQCFKQEGTVEIMEILFDTKRMQRQQKWIIIDGQ